MHFFRSILLDFSTIYALFGFLPILFSYSIFKIININYHQYHNILIFNIYFQPKSDQKAKEIGEKQKLIKILKKEDFSFRIIAISVIIDGFYRLFTQ